MSKTGLPDLAHAPPEPTTAGGPAASATTKQKAAAIAAGNAALANILSDDEVARRIRARTGTKVHEEYEHVFKVDNGTGRAFRAALPIVTKVVNDALKRAGIAVTLDESELAANFLAEGGDQLLARDVGKGIDGFGHAGIDTLMQKLAELAPYLPPDLLAFARDKRNHVTHTNERGEQVHSLQNLAIDQALQANASMYALALSDLTGDLRGLSPPVDVATLPELARVFWTELYFNAGSGRGKKDLIAHGVDWYKERWTKHRGDGSSPKYNALVRSGSWELLDHATDGDDS